MKLIPLSEYVLNLDKDVKIDEFGELPIVQLAKNFAKVLKYAKFLEQELTLGMFLPCDENDKVLEKPADDDFSFYTHKNISVKEEYELAEKKVIFKDLNFFTHRPSGDCKFYRVGDTQVFNLSENPRHLYWQVNTFDELIQASSNEIEITLEF